MSREPGREGTEASEAWREAGRDMVGVGAPRRREGQLGQLALGLVLAFFGGVARITDAVQAERQARALRIS